MILDHLENADAYNAMHPLFVQAFAFLRRPDLAQMEAGRYEIDGDRLYAMVFADDGKDRGNDVLEAHRQYIDIQYTISGAECHGWKSTASCTDVKTDYDENVEAILFFDAPAVWVDAPPSHFVVFLQDDAHSPMNGKGRLHKVVVKVKL